MNSERIPGVAFCCACMGKKKKTPRCVINSNGSDIYWFKKLNQPSDKLMVMDYQRKSLIGGKVPQIIDFATKSVVMIQPQKNNVFAGYDFKTKSPFGVVVNDDIVEFYEPTAEKPHKFFLKY